MKRLLFILVLFYLFASKSAESQNDTIQNVINNISADSIKRNVEVLENFPSRFLFSEYKRQVAFYLKDRMQNYGFEVEVDSFYVEDLYFLHNVPVNSGWMYNVLCLKKGTNNAEDKSLFLAAHYDCISNREEDFTDYEHFAPGADDNASGVAVLLELARVWQESNVVSEHNLRIEFYDGEELSFQGSDHRLYQLSQPWSMEIMGMINLDMVGYNKSDTLKINHYDNSEDLTSKAVDYTLLYSDLTPKPDTELIERSDSWVFYSWGLKALFLTENDFSPYYHTLQDSSKYLDFNYMKKICGISFALVFDILSAEISPVSLNRPFSINIRQINKDRILITTNLCSFRFDKIFIVDSYGRTIKLETNLSNQSCEIDISYLKNGIYNLLIYDKNNMITKRFLKL